MMVLLAAVLSGAAVYAGLGGLTAILARHRLGVGTAADRGLSARTRQRLISWRAIDERWPLARRRTESDRQAAVVQLCRAMVAELRAGSLPADALVRAAAGYRSAWPGRSRSASVAPRAVAAARSGMDVVAALHADAAQPGASGLRGLAACLQVASTTGAGLADAVVRVLAALRAEQEQRDRVAAELAAPRATARLLAALPLIGLGLGHAIGADPLRVLLGTGWGRLVAILGAGLDLAGFLWVSAIARRAERIR